MKGFLMGGDEVQSFLSPVSFHTIQLYDNLDDTFHFYPKVPGVSSWSLIWATMATECSVTSASHRKSSTHLFPIYDCACRFISIILVICRSRSCWGRCCSSLWFRYDIPSFSFWRLPYKWKHDSTQYYVRPPLRVFFLWPEFEVKNPPPVLRDCPIIINENMIQLDII